MSNLSKTNIAKAKEAFEQHPEDDTMLVCSDGNVFRLEVKNLADLHCKQNKLDAPVTVTREQVDPKPDTSAADKAAAKAKAKAAADKAAAEEKEKADAAKATAAKLAADNATAEEKAKEDAAKDTKTGEAPKEAAAKKAAASK